MKLLNPDEVLQPALDQLLPPFTSSTVSKGLSPGSDGFTSTLENMSALIQELLPRPQMFPAEKCLTPSADVLLPSFDQPSIDEVLSPAAEELLPLVGKLLPQARN
jgi:hypothetical protein